jgi:hypothetical protein
MADIVLQQDEQLPIPTQVRYKDMRDGTYALVYATLISGEDCNSNGVVFRVDADTSGLVVVSHYETDVHNSNRFKASYLQPHGSELADDAVHDFLIRVGPLCAHATLRTMVGGNCDLLFYEGTTVSNNGNALDIISKNREVLGTAQTLTYEGPTVTGVGTLLFSWFVLGGTKHALGAGGWGETPWLLAPNTNYMVRITNRSGAAIQLSVSLGWSEH